MIKVIYWTGTGNTQKMAENIMYGMKEAGQEVEILEVSNAMDKDIIDAEVLVLGCPAMGVEELDDSEMLPFIENNGTLMKDKKIALFGSYGWGTGEWMEAWKEQMISLGVNLVAEPLIVNEFTDGQDEAVCNDYGKKIVG